MQPAGFSVAGGLQDFFSQGFRTGFKTTSPSKNLPARLTPFARKGVSAWCRGGPCQEGQDYDYDQNSDSTDFIKIQYCTSSCKRCTSPAPQQWAAGPAIDFIDDQIRTSSRLF